jgi:hypothetical protein
MYCHLLMTTQGDRIANSINWALIARNYNNCNATANVHTKQITIAHAVSVCYSIP